MRRLNCDSDTHLNQFEQGHMTAIFLITFLNDSGFCLNASSVSLPPCPSSAREVSKSRFQSQHSLLYKPNNICHI